MTKPQEFTVAPVRSDDPKAQKKPEDEKDQATKDGAKKGDDKEKDSVELVSSMAAFNGIEESHSFLKSEEDQALKNELEMLFERLRVSLELDARRST